MSTMKPRFNTAFLANTPNRLGLSNTLAAALPHKPSPGLFSALEFAQQEASSLGARFVDTSHILIALIHEASLAQRNTINARLTNFYNLRYSNVLDKASSYFGLEAEATPITSNSNLTEATKRLFVTSANMARRYSSSVIKPEHVLLAITMATNKSGAAYGTLIDLGIDPQELNTKITGLIQKEICEEFLL